MELLNLPALFHRAIRIIFVYIWKKKSGMSARKSSRGESPPIAAGKLAFYRYLYMYLYYTFITHTPWSTTDRMGISLIGKYPQFSSIVPHLIIMDFCIAHFEEIFSVGNSVFVNSHSVNLNAYIYNTTLPTKPQESQAYKVILLWG